MRKRALPLFNSFLLVLLVFLCVSHADALASVSGTLSTGLTWEISDANVLTVSGAGAIGDDMPWKAYSDQVVEVVLNPGVTAIGEAAFYEFSQLEKVTLPTTLQTIGDGAFVGCSKLSQMPLNEGLVRIGEYAFQNTALTSIRIPSSVTEINEYSFAVLEGTLQSIDVDPGNALYASVDGVLFSKDGKTLIAYPRAREADAYAIPPTVTAVGDYAFWNARVREVSIPYGVQVLGNGAFYRSYITSLVLPDSITEVGDFLCHDCANLVSVKLGAGLKKLNYRAFRNCSTLTNLDLGTTVEELDSQAFYNCTSLMHIDLPEGLIKINSQAFYRTDLTNVRVPASVTFIGEDAFPEDAVLEFARPLTQDYDGSYSYIDIASIPVEAQEDYTAAFDVLKLVNKERKKQGLSALEMDASLLESAMMRGAELGVFFSHTRPNGQVCFSANRKMNAENIAASFASPKQVMEGWMNSPGHRANILGDGFTCIGIGSVVVDGVRYWAQCFSSDAPVVAKISDYANHSKVVQVGLLTEDLSNIKESEVYEILTSPKSVEVEVGESQEVKLGVNNTFALMWTKNEHLKFTSTDESVCTVNRKGNVQGVSAGSAKICIFSKEESDKVLIEVPVKVTEKKAEVSKHYAVDGLRYTVTEIKGKNGKATLSGVVSNGITSIAVPNTVTISGVKCKVTVIGKGACKGLKKLKEVTIGKEVSQIESEAFANCKKLKKITFAGTGIKKIGERAFKGISAKAIFIAPNKKATAYKKLLTKTTGFTSNMQVKPKSAKGTDAVLPKKGAKATVGAFQYKVTKSSKTKGTVQLVGIAKKTAASYKIPATVKIGKYKFSVTGIAKNTWKGCKRVKTIALPKSITKIEKKAFPTAGKLTVTVPKAQRIKLSKLVKQSGAGKNVNVKVR